MPFLHTACTPRPITLGTWQLHGTHLRPVSRPSSRPTSRPPSHPIATTNSTTALSTSPSAFLTLRLVSSHPPRHPTSHLPHFTLPRSAFHSLSPPFFRLLSSSASQVLDLPAATFPPEAFAPIRRYLLRLPLDLANSPPELASLAAWLGPLCRPLLRALFIAADARQLSLHDLLAHYVPALVNLAPAAFVPPRRFQNYLALRFALAIHDLPAALHQPSATPPPKRPRTTGYLFEGCPECAREATSPHPSSRRDDRCARVRPSRDPHHLAVAVDATAAWPAHWRDGLLCQPASAGNNPTGHPVANIEHGHALSTERFPTIRIEFNRTRGRKRERDADETPSSLCPAMFQGHDLWRVFHAARMLRTVVRHVLRYAREDHVLLLLDFVLRGLADELSDEDIAGLLDEFDWEGKACSAAVERARPERWSPRSWRLLALAQANNACRSAQELRMWWHSEGLVGKVLNARWDSRSCTLTSSTQWLFEQTAYALTLQWAGSNRSPRLSLLLRVVDPDAADRRFLYRKMSMSVDVTGDGCMCGGDHVQVFREKKSDERAVIWELLVDRNHDGVAFSILDAQDFCSWLQTHQVTCGLIFAVTLRFTEKVQHSET